MNSLFPSLIGNEHTKNLLAADIRRGTFLHACVLEAPSGSGIDEVAVEIAAAIACKNKSGERLPCGRCQSCESILGGSCVDVITIDKGDKASIGVDKIRELKQDAVLTPSVLEYKIYIVKEAEKLTEEAQNAFLKLLEEPPVRNTYFILCTDNASALLTTVRSRAPVTRFTPPERRELCDVLMRECGASREEALYAAAVSKNAVSTAKEVLKNTDEGKRIKALYEQAKTVTKMLAEKKPKAELLLYVSSLSVKKDDLADILRLIYCALRDIIAVKRCKNCETDEFATAEEARKCAGSLTVRSAVCISDEVTAALASLEKNASPKTVLLSFAVGAHNALFG